MNLFNTLPLLIVAGALLSVVPSASQAAPGAAVCTSVDRRPLTDSNGFPLTNEMMFRCGVGVGIKTIPQLGALGWKIATASPIVFAPNEAAWQIVIDRS